MPSISLENILEIIVNYIKKTEFYNKDYLVIPPGKIFSDEEITKWYNQALNILPNYSDSFNQNAEVKPSTEIGKIKIFGMPIQHRLKRGACISDNFLFGKRAVLEIFNWKSHNY